MKFVSISALLAVSSAFVIPEEEVFSILPIEASQEVESAWDNAPSTQDVFDKLYHGIEETFDGVVDKAENIIDRILEAASDSKDNVVDDAYRTAFDVQGWLDSADEIPCEASFEDPEDHPHHPPGRRPPHRRPPHRRPHHPPHHGGPQKPNLTIYEMIAKSKYTTKLAKLINEYDDLVELLNGTTANFTVFAPTDAAFEKIPKHAPKPSKEFLKKLLTYHVSPSFYPAGRVFAADTIPTALNESALGGSQRLAIKLGLRGLTVNFYSRIIAANIYATNGVIHRVDSILLPPPPIGKIMDLLPEEFSTLELAFLKTGLAYELYNMSHVGGTVFAPSNFAFKKLGPGPNAFLFSRPGLKYLKALLKYHLVINETLYSDTFYGPKGHDDQEDVFPDVIIPRRSAHFDLPTLLGGRSLPVDLVRFGPFISMKVNGYVRIVVKDGIAKDGVIHIPADVLIPPKQMGRSDDWEDWVGGEITVPELKERLDPYVEEDDESSMGEGMKWEM